MKDLEYTAKELYNAGWLPSDIAELKEKYQLTDEKADELFRELIKIEYYHPDMTLYYLIHETDYNGDNVFTSCIFPAELTSELKYLKADETVESYIVYELDSNFLPFQGYAAYGDNFRTLKKDIMSLKPEVVESWSREIPYWK